VQSLTGSVGQGGTNRRHDVALVEVLLNLARRPATLDLTRARYLGNTDGVADAALVAAIRRFQDDQTLLARARNGAPRLQPTAAANASGVITAGDASWTSLVAAVPAEYGALRVLDGSKIVYVADPIARRTANVQRAAALSFAPVFAGRVRDLIQRIHARHGIAISVNVDGDRRTFQKQYELATDGRGTTNAGPGESNHNYGQAVDLGFAGLRWFRADASLVTNETSWLHRLDPGQRGTGEATIFWDMLRSEGGRIGLHRGPIGDRPHLQAWNDQTVSMGTRLAVLLTLAGQMRWQRGARINKVRHYECDLGYGGKFFDVGSAAQIWARQSTITALLLEQARAQAGPPPSATQADIVAMREALRADFERAEARWSEWTP
jgi:hypothetical protein